MKKYLSIIPILFLLLSCNKGVEIPENLLSKEDMVEILIDVHIGEATAQRLSMRIIDENVLKEHTRETVFQQYCIDSLSFATSLEFYLQDMELLDDIYAEVLDSLQAKANKPSTKALKKDQ